ncbi:MAG: hypothetical protein J6X82_05475 [Bacteroidales bacterium]|nr:hypothetical protein [Bacteroidales bacterium]
MKKLIILFSALLCAAAALAQTPEEILSRMEAAMNAHEKDGIAMVVDVKMPILGTMSSKTYAVGEKFRVEVSMAGVDVITWSDGKTKWTYTSKDNEVVIENENPDRPTSSDSDTEMFSGIAEGYDVSLSKETDKAWYFNCKKSKTNKDKDAPKSIDIVVAKGTYYPISLSAQLKGVSITMRNVTFGVSDKQVSFNAKDYPDVKITDKR